MSVKVMQLNAHKSMSASSNLINELFEDEGRQIALLQEPYCYKNRPSCLGRSLQILYGAGDTPRMAIVATKDVPLWFLNDFSGPDMTTAVLKSCLLYTSPSPRDRG